MLIEEYFQKIEADIASCPYIFESRVLKDKRSLYIGENKGVRSSFLTHILLWCVQQKILDDQRKWYVAWVEFGNDWPDFKHGDFWEVYDVWLRPQ